MAFVRASIRVGISGWEERLKAECRTLEKLKSGKLKC